MGCAESLKTPSGAIPSYVASYVMLHNEVMLSELRIGELFADT